MVHRNQKVTVELLSIGSLSRKGSHETAGEIMSLKKLKLPLTSLLNIHDVLAIQSFNKRNICGRVTLESDIAA